MSKIQILVGSVGGTASKVAEFVAQVARDNRHQVSINAAPKTEDLLRDPDEVLLICTSNTGAGDLPANVLPLYIQLNTEYPPIAGRRYGLINLGDSSYSTFGEAGQRLDEAFADLGAIRQDPPLILDASSGLDPEEEAREWAQAWLESL
ncbi:flavodoxin domain-containing protein [Marinimicrobium sp. ABcell2]|uniref:flavodoxin domain-containing protein n=1 Tax=Marinimicrobium sp. ABcell2 TaxID=3069751 RepID=UPI0027B3407B|nr:flavodoxin domain-containing protein [Marinimicrobium sp. ABcell2]MDQ2075216.1 flavodoxin domain-containing protein [Marinimicrobium sp. ABcell2]